VDVYLAIAVKSFQRSLTYRAANVAGIVTNTFFGAIYVFVYVALLKDRGAVGGLDMRDAITYVIVSQSLLMAMSAFGNRDLSEAIIRGEIISDLCRPTDFYLLWAAIDLGRGVYFLIFRGIPTYVLGAILFGIRVPADPLTWGAFTLCLLTGMVVSFAFRFIANSLAFWTTDARGLNYLTNTVVMFFSGFIVPLNFFPPGLRTLTEWLPFRALAHLPISVYLGKVDGAELAGALVQQALWLVALAAIGRFVLSRMVRRLAINGG
jgi:ABC-2 type transport system permease protein